MIDDRGVVGGCVRREKREEKVNKVGCNKGILSKSQNRRLCKVERQFARVQSADKKT